MNNTEGLADEHFPSAALPPRKDHARVAEPLPPPDAVTALTNGFSEPDCSDETVQAGASYRKAVRKDNDSGHDLAVHGSNQLSKNLAESMNACVMEHTLVGGSMGPASGCEGNGCETKKTAGEFPPDSPVKQVEESEPSEAHQLARIGTALRCIGLRSVESSSIFRPNESLANEAHGGTEFFEYGVSNITPSGSQHLLAVNNDYNITPSGIRHRPVVNDDDAGKSPVAGSAVGSMVPPSGTLAPIDGGRLTTGGVLASSSHELIGEMEFLLDKLDRIDLHSQVRVQEHLRTSQQQTEELMQNRDMVCPDNDSRGQKAAKLRRRLDQARKRAQLLENEFVLREESCARDLEFLFAVVEDLREKILWLLAVNRERMHRMHYQPSGWSHSALWAATRLQMDLHLEVDRLRQELLQKVRRLRALDMRFKHFRQTSQEKYQTAIDDIIKKDTMRQRAIKTLEAEVDVVSGCPALMELLSSLRGGSRAEEEATSSSDTPTSSVSGASAVNRKTPTDI